MQVYVFRFAHTCFLIFLAERNSYHPDSLVILARCRASVDLSSSEFEQSSSIREFVFIRSTTIS